MDEVIQDFYMVRDTNRSQFGVLYLANIDNLNEFDGHFIPSQHGMPVIDNTHPLSPADVRNYGNYLAARPAIIDTRARAVHSERQLLYHSRDLWNAYLNRFHRTPNFLLLYSWIMPCENCTNEIINTLNQQPFQNIEHRVVAYTVEGTGRRTNLSYMTPERNRRNRQRLQDAALLAHRQTCQRPGQNSPVAILQSGSQSDWQTVEDETDDPDTHTCAAIDTLQGCIFREVIKHLPNLCCGCKPAGVNTMIAALINEITLSCAKSIFLDCVTRWLATNIGDAIHCPKFSDTLRHVLPTASECWEKRMSNPLDPYNPFNFPGLLVDISRLSKFVRPDLTTLCQDSRTQGYLCSHYTEDSFTAGNSLCRYGDKCGYHGYKYSWCYTSFSNHWDYCCTGPCGRAGGTDYWWCRSGSKWQYCGDSGRVVGTEGKSCLPSHPCGVHNEDGKAKYYWCLKDNNRNYQYCCQPEDSCSTKGYSYNWCYTGWKKDTSWQYCTP